MVSAKRGKAERSGIHAWHPYYAGYSESFVESAISYLQCDSATLILDPWCGGGTTNAVASRHGIRSIGVDINPAMSIFAAAKSPVVLDYSNEITDFFTNLHLHSEIGSGEDWSDAPLLAVFSPDTARLLQSIIERIPFTGSPIISQTGEDSHIDGDILEASIDQSKLLSPAYAFVISVIFVVVRKHIGPTKASNPTWSNISDVKQDIEPGNLSETLKETCHSMLCDLQTFYATSKHTAPSAIASTDSRCLPLRDNTIDRIITSPPYLTRIDYAISTQLEILLLADSTALTFVRHNTMGAPVITKSKKEQNPMWGKTCNDILSRIKVHETKAAATYYWKNIIQYFSDAHVALKELHRVLKPGGKGLIVVQSSYFKEIEIPLGQIYVEMAKQLGFKSSIAYREEVKGHMAHVNTKSSVYKQGKIYYEDFVEIEK